MVEGRVAMPYRLEIGPSIDERLFYTSLSAHRLYRLIEQSCTSFQRQHKNSLPLTCNIFLNSCEQGRIFHTKDLSYTHHNALLSLSRTGDRAEFRESELFQISNSASSIILPTFTKTKSWFVVRLQRRASCTLDVELGSSRNTHLST